MVAILGAIALAVMSVFRLDSALALPADISQFFLIVTGIALLSGVLGTTMYYRGIKHIPAVQASIFELSFPLTGFLLDVFIQNKIPDQFQMVG
jgi:drug/metabolite transporter (DMT)-like permease